MAAASELSLALYGLKGGISEALGLRRISSGSKRGIHCLKKDFRTGTSGIGDYGQRAMTGYAPVEPEVVFIWRDIFASRVKRGGYSIDDVLA